MFTLLQDTLAAMSLKARSRRLAHERALRLMEGDSDAEAGWQPLGGGRAGAVNSRVVPGEVRTQARRLAVENPHAKNVLRLMEAYVVGADCQVSARPAAEQGTGSGTAATTADRLWREFLNASGDHFCFREFARRTWRDGECFLRLFATADWPPSVRFVDPERIGPTAQAPDSQGVLVEPTDAETVRAYLLIDPASGELVEAVPAAEMLHTKINADSNEARGISLLAPLIAPLTAYERWLETELVARRLAASVVLWRKVDAGPVGAFGSPADDALGLEPARRERFAPGSILTTSRDTDLSFLQPPAHITDAVPLGRMILLAAAAGAGLPEFMLSADASNANYASTLIAEGPAVRLFEGEQRFFATQLGRLWRWVMGEAVRHGRLPAEYLAIAEPVWTFPTLVARDRPRERYADVRLVHAGILSRAEVARREGVDATTMRAELAAEKAAHANADLPGSLLAPLA